MHNARLRESSNLYDILEVGTITDIMFLTDRKNKSVRVIILAVLLVLNTWDSLSTPSLFSFRKTVGFLLHFYLNNNE